MSEQPRYQILVVDDEPLIGNVVRRSLRTDHDVTAVTSGEAALELLRGGRSFELILCDLYMPGLTGLELHAILAREAPELADRIVFMSGDIESSDAPEGDRRPPRLAKPFDANELREAVAAHLARLGR